MSPRGVAADPAERAGAILDAAARLLLRYGHDRTTISDIAREAGVAKGSVYAHWRSRELLFLALLRREQATLLRALRERLRRAGGPVGLRDLIAETVRAYQASPLVIAVMTRNSEILGGLARAAAAEKSPQAGIVDLLQTLRGGGWIRTDQTLAEQVTVLSAVYLGYFLTAPLMPAEFRVPDDGVPGLIAGTVHRALERPEPLTPDEVAAVDREIHAYVDAALAAAEQRLRAARLSEEESS